MDRFDRIYQLDKILQQRRFPVSMAVLKEEMECSKPTVTRTIAALRNYFQAPLEYSSEKNGYYYDTQNGNKPYELPGLWFNASELHALLVVEHFLAQIDNGLCKEELAPFHQRIQSLLDKSGIEQGSNFQRIRIINIAHRKNRPHCFRKTAEAVLQRHQLFVEYKSRNNNKISQRTISPQQLVHYKDNWYLDAWCHQRGALRTFSLDCIKKLETKNIKAKEISADQLHQHYASAYGIFAGKAKQIAILEFTADRARWVAAEEWHPEQQGSYTGNGNYQLKIPYNEPRELLMEILKYGADVKVLEPESLRDSVIKSLQKALTEYQ